MKRTELARWFVVLCVVLALLAVLGGCGKAPEPQEKTPQAEAEAVEKTEIIFWHSYVVSTQPALKRLVKKFEEEHPEIDIQEQYVQTGDALLQKLAAAITTGNAPDICWIHDDWLAPLSEQDTILDFEELAKEYGGFDDAIKEDFIQAPLQISYYNGRLGMMPIEATSMALAYNRDLFRKAGLDPNKPPANWDEFVEYGKKLTIREGEKTTQWAFFIPVFTGQLSSYGVWQWQIFLWGEGGLYADPSGEKVVFNSDAGVRALQFWADLQNKYKIGSINTPEQGFESQRVAMSLMGSWDLPHLKELTFDWALAPIPAGRVKKVYPYGGEYLVIFKQTEHPKEAWEFVRWFITPEVQEAWSIDSGYLPIRRSVLDSPTYLEYLETDPALKVYAEQMRDAYLEPVKPPKTTEIDLYLATALEKAVRDVPGRVSPKAALDEAAEKSNKVLAEARAKE